MALPASDTFTRADNADLGTNWTTVPGTDPWAVAGNDAQEASSGNRSAEYWNADALGNDQESWVVLVGTQDTAANSGVGPAVSMDTASDTMYFAVANSNAAGEIQLGRAAAGVITFPASYTAGSAPIAGDEIRLRRTGALLEVLHNGVVRISYTDPSPLANTTRAGICGKAFSGVKSIASWGANNVATSGTPSPNTGSLTLTGYAPDAGVSNPQPVNRDITLYVYAVSGTPTDILLSDPSTQDPATGAVFITVPTGVLAIAGDLPTFLHTDVVIITPPVGTLKFGQPYTADTTKLTADSSVTADRGTSLRAPTVLIGTSITPAAGALTLTGFAPTVNASRSARPNAGALILTGLVATILVSNNISVAPNVGSLTLTGQPPTVVNGTVRAPATGSLVLTGQVATIVNGTVRAPATGSLVLTGQAPSISVPLSVTPNAGSLVLTGFAPTPNIGVNITTNVGSLVLTGQVPTASVTNNVAVAPAAGALTLTGQPPTVLTPRVVLPATGALALTGFSPTPNIGVNVTTATGSLLLTGRVPTVNVSDHKTAAPATGSLVLTGYAPIAGGANNVTVSTATGQLILTGKVPGVQTAEPQAYVIVGTAYDVSVVMQGVAMNPQMKARDYAVEIDASDLGVKLKSRDLIAELDAILITTANG